MAQQLPKPPPFMPGAKAISAHNLNALRQAIPSILRGGRGITITPFGDRYVVALAPDQGNPAAPFALMTVVEEFDYYVECERDGISGQTVLVAKPWAMRKGVDFPTGPEYVYSDEEVGARTADGVDDNLYPPYQVGEELLCVRLPSARIPDEDLGEDPPEITWLDVNLAGRMWGGKVGDHWHNGDDCHVLVPDETLWRPNEESAPEARPLGIHYNSADELWYSNRAKWG